jgi:hypothetical protein
MQHGDIVSDHSRFTDYHASAVIDKNSLSHSGGGMDIQCKNLGDTVLTIECEWLSALKPQPVRYPIGLQSVKSFVMQKGFCYAARRRISAGHCYQVSTERLSNIRRRRKRFIHYFPERHG